MRPAAALGTLLLAAAPLWAQDDLPPGYPPKMGEISGTLGGKAVAWETFDFSIGAFDASAQATQDGASGEVTLRLVGHRPGEPDNRQMRATIEGSFGPALRPGAAADVEIAIYRGADWDGPRLTSAGQNAELVIDSIGPKVADSYSRRVTGHASARLCPKNWLLKSCQDVVLRFDTDVQIDGTLPIERR
jgi:hypothetical protein